LEFVYQSWPSFTLIELTESEMSKGLLILQGLAAISAFTAGSLAVRKWQNRGTSGATIFGTKQATALPSESKSNRPKSQLPIRSFEQIVKDTDTQVLIDSIERRCALSQDVFESDCLPILRAFAEYVQFLPASESHHHAQPGGLWIHALEVVDAALAFRAGMELPKGRGTEDRKRFAHRWTVGVFLAALLHDLGKPMADMRVSLYGELVHDGHPWAALAGPMKAAGPVSHYTVEFADAGEKDYLLHQKLPAILMQRFVPEAVLRWLSDDPDLIRELLQYLSGDSKDGVLGDIVKRADSDSVRKNLLTGSRTRFASARTTPLIERLMSALRRILQEGSALPLNRAGAAGWVFDDSLWVVCGRMADEIRTYLAENESLSGIPTKEKNDRIFDCFQEYGGAITNPETQGAVWRVLVECDEWKSPGVLTVLRFPLSILFEAGAYPRQMNGSLTIVESGTKGSKASAPASTEPAEASQQTPPQISKNAKPSPPPEKRIEPTLAPSPAPSAISVAPSIKDGSALVKKDASQDAHPEPDSMPPPWECIDQSVEPPKNVLPAASPEPSSLVTPPPPPVEPAGSTADDEFLDCEAAAPQDISKLLGEVKRNDARTDLIAPVKPMDPPKRGTLPRKDGSPAAKAFMRWVQLGVNNGELKYNETSALVHFAPEGCLLLSPEIFKRFVREHKEVQGGEVADLLTQYGDRAYARLQNEFGKSPWTIRNGDENLHYYAFTKHAGGISPPSSFYLIGQPDLFWRPVPEPNHRIVKANRPPKKPKAQEQKSKSQE
jgi:integrating conjugative element relaxase (TIGR03760 family)